MTQTSIHRLLLLVGCLDELTGVTRTVAPAITEELRAAREHLVNAVIKTLEEG